MTARTGRPGTGRLMRARSSSAARTPFVLLVVVLLSGGLVTLLLLNSAINQGAFQLSKLKQQTRTNTDQEQQLQQEVAQLSAPEKLERRVQRLGMVPGGNPAFLSPDGKVRGVPAPPNSSATPQPDMPSEAPAPADESAAESADAPADSTTETTDDTGTGTLTSTATGETTGR
ncbi:MAG: cell division protein FtsL [Streptomycetaceae bacterium]|nr:cell division protein FtsL [Streptomycetaceae bacterium]